MLNINGFGGFSFANNKSIHSWFFAFLMYFFGVLHMYLFYFKINNNFVIDKYQISTHLFCLFTCIPLNILMLIIASIVYSSCSTHICNNFLEPQLLYCFIYLDLKMIFNIFQLVFWLNLLNQIRSLIILCEITYFLDFRIVYQ
jgi:hypothetical protein